MSNRESANEKTLTPGLYFNGATALRAGDRIHISYEDGSIAFFRGKTALTLVTTEGTAHLKLLVGCTKRGHCEDLAALICLLLGIRISLLNTPDEKKKGVPANTMIFEITE